MKTLLRQASLLAADGDRRELTDIAVSGTTIEAVGALAQSAEREIDLNGLWVLPGGVDPHVHVRDLGQREKEDWSSASAAALAGGYTTIFDMPNTIPPTNDAAALELKRTAAAAAAVSWRLWLGATEHNLDELRSILAGNPRDVAGIKVFLAGSSSNEVVHHPHTLRALMRLAAEFDVPLAVHQELQSCLDGVPTAGLAPHARNHGRFRPRECTVAGARLALETAVETGCRLYLVHVSTAEEVALLRELKSRGRIFAEVTPHHLLLDETILETAGNWGKVNPPLRGPADCRALLDAVSDGLIDCIGSDHAPHAMAEKALAYPDAPSGFPGLETSMSLLFDAAARGAVSYRRVEQLTSAVPARIFGLEDRGAIEAGRRADLTIVDPSAEWKVTPELFRSKARYSPYRGSVLTGRVVATVCNGVYRETVQKEG